MTDEELLSDEELHRRVMSHPETKQAIREALERPPSDEPGVTAEELPEFLRTHDSWALVKTAPPYSHRGAAVHLAGGLSGPFACGTGTSDVPMFRWNGVAAEITCGRCRKLVTPRS